MEKIKEGTVVFVYHEDLRYYPTDDPQIIRYVNEKNPNHTLYETDALHGLGASKNLETSDIQVATAEPVPEKYLNLINREYIDLQSATKTDFYDTTGIQVMNGKDFVETCYDEWSDFFQETEEFPEYVESLGVPLDKISLDNVYAVNIVKGEVEPIYRVTDLEEFIKKSVKPGYREGSAKEYRSSEEYFNELAQKIGKDQKGELKQPIIEVKSCPGNPDIEGYHTETSYLRANRFMSYSNGQNYFDQSQLNIYTKADLHGPTHQGISGNDYLAIHDQKEQNKTPFYNEHSTKENVVGTGFYYSDLLTHYHKENLENTTLKEGQSFNEGESTTVLDTGKYSYEYDHAVKSLDKINNEKGYIEKSYEVDSSPETKRTIEKDIAGEIEREPEREIQRREMVKKQKEQLLRRRGLER